MGASDWDDCPRCAARAERKISEATTALLDSYGRVPLAVFDKARAVIAEIRAPSGSFRESYAISGACEGVITVSYQGSCQVCGLSADFSCEHPFWGQEDEK